MRLSRRHFPHPVLSEFSDDLPGKIFTYELRVEPTRKRDAYLFSAKFSLTSATLAGLIAAGEGCFALHVECPGSRFRNLWTTQDSSLEFTIGLEQLDGEVQVNGLILASRHLRGYASPEFHADYAGHTFEVRQGDILALGRPRKFYPNKIDAHASIFVLARNPLSNPPEITYGLNNERIVIHVPDTLMDKYIKLEEFPEYRPVLHSMTVLPVLVSILHTLQRRDGVGQDESAFEEVHEQYRGRRWYRVLERGLADLGISNWSIDDPVATANELLKSVLGRAFASLEEQELSRGQQSGGDEE